MVSAGTLSVSNNIGDVSEIANDTSIAAAQIEQASNRLAAQSDSLKSAVQTFLQSVRAA